ncbi:MAG: DUF4332 domain-containing protein [Planctomycetota bacterium]|nr:DUF4332 domain-containing protein [Planctomycetota bacterium]MDA1179572.1 DUF4332 domain-containing protein [Planctomycetota bacterium]
MKIGNVVLERKGQLSPLRLQNLSAGLNLIYGPAGSGKSDLMYSIPTVLYRTRMHQPLGHMEAHLDPGSVATLDVVDDNGQPNRLSGEVGILRETNVSSLGDADFRRMFICDGTLPAVVWPSILQAAAGYGLHISRVPNHRNHQGEHDRHRRIRECRYRLDSLGSVSSSRTSLESERQQLEDQLASLRDSRVRELAQADRQLRTAQIEREQTARRIERVARLIDRLDRKIRRRAQMAEMTRSNTEPYPTWRRHSTPDHDVLHTLEHQPFEYRWSGTAIHRHLVRWEALHEQIREEVVGLRRLQASDFEQPETVPQVANHQLAYLIRSLDLELDELESQSLEIENAIFADDSSATVRNLRSLVDSLLARAPSNDARDLGEPWRRSRGALHQITISKGLELLEHSADQLRVLIEELRLRNDGTELDRVISSYSTTDGRRSSEFGDRSMADNVSTLHERAVDRLSHRRARLLDVQKELQNSLHVSESRLDTTWHISRIEDESVSIRLRVERIDRDLAILAEQDRLTRELYELEREHHNADFRRDELGVARDTSILLQRLTRGELLGVSFDEWFGVSVVGRTGTRQLHSELRSELQSVVAICLQLALVAAYSRAGRVMPLLIDLRHAEWTLDGLREFVPILSELAATGQQILVFTAIREIVPMFERFPVSIYTLVRRTITERVNVDGVVTESPQPRPAMRTRDAVDFYDQHPAVGSRVNLFGAKGASSTEDRSSIWRSSSLQTSLDHTSDSTLWPWPRRTDDNRSTIPFGDVPIMASDSSKSAVRYYLNRGDDVVDAPSIGPRMAERLYQVGVRTVNDLVQSDPVTLAKRLEHRGTTSAVVRDWQDQARLMCQVPYLRGHDAALLVACGVREPHQLSGRDAQSLLVEVDQLTSTQEGRRIIRTGKKPDLSEIQDWIQWAQQARTLEAA